jgi:hypothetical protein
VTTVRPLRDVADLDETRPPPHNNDAEQALIGAVLCNNKVLRSLEFLQPEHFGNALHARIYKAIGKMVDRKQVANPVTLKDQFERDGAIVEIGAVPYLMSLVRAGEMLTSGAIGDYGRMIHDLFMRRQMIAISEDLAADAHRQEPGIDRASALARSRARLDQLGELARAAVGGSGHDPHQFAIEAWLNRDLADADYLLGSLLSTTSRLLVIGPTGIGKSNFLIALGIAVAAGRDFLHWRGCGRPARVLYVDGEMSRRLAKKRLVDAVRRHGGAPDGFFYLNREDCPDLPPLDTEAGQKFIDRIIDALGTVDLLILDNVQALLGGDMKDEEPWQQTLPWVRDLTRRNIGQIWAHHTGHDESHGYGSKTREWQLDTVGLMETVERPEADLAFSIKFTKAREREPENRSDFDLAVVTLTNDAWGSEPGTLPRRGKQQAKDRALTLLIDAVARHGTIPAACEYIPPDTPAVTIGLWRNACQLGCISEGDEKAVRRAFERSAKKLLTQGLIGKHGLFVWPVR